MGYFLLLLLSIPFMEGLIALSVRCIQPIQQQGRRSPSLSWLTTLSTCSLRVSIFLGKIVQQIHSLRASGVRPFHKSRATESLIRAFFKSSGNSCTVPDKMVLLMSCFYQMAEGGRFELPNAFRRYALSKRAH